MNRNQTKNLVFSEPSSLFLSKTSAQKFINYHYCGEGFVAAHTLPVLYEQYEDEVDDFAYRISDKLQHHYRKLDMGFLSKIPKGKVIAKKLE